MTTRNSQRLRRCQLFAPGSSEKMMGKAAALAEATQRLEELKARQEELEREKRVRAVLRSPP